MIKSNSSSSVTSVLDPLTGNLAGPLRSANIINEYFCGIGKTLDDKLPAGHDPETLYQVNTRVRWVSVKIVQPVRLFRT